MAYPTFHTCRFCNQTAQLYVHGKGYQLIHYSTRSYAHTGCMLDKLGVKAFDRLSTTQLKEIDRSAVAMFGFIPELDAEIARREKR